MTPSEIQPGMKFGHWEVIKFDHVNEHRIKYFLCKCDVCGTTRPVRADELIKGLTTACSPTCANSIIGQHFGNWEVLSFNRKEKSGKKYYNCRCSCGTEKPVREDHLKSGKTKSCGCLQKQQNEEKANSHIGEKYGSLTIIGCHKEDYYGTKAYFYDCVCDCGNSVSVNGHALFSGHTKSCGCLLGEKYKNLAENHIGERFGKLTVLDCELRKNAKGYNNYYYKCQCDCGSIIWVRGNHLLCGDTYSCGCINSKANERMALLLNKYNIPFKREYRTELCKDKSYLPFDFAIFNKQGELIGLIENNGSQHYSARGSHWDTEEKLIITQKHDKMKQAFAEQYDIPLLIIPYQYFKVDDMEKFLITSDFWKIITKNFND